MTDFNTFWKRWRGPVKGRLANENEGREEARIQFDKLSEPHRRLAHQWGPHFQKEHRKANGDDCSMLHCCRYLSKKRFLNYEDMEAPEEKKPEPIVFDDDDPWRKQKQALLYYLGEPVYRQWLMDMVIQSHVNDGYTVYFPSPFKAKYVKEAWQPTFESDRVFNARVRFTVAQGEK